MKMLRITSKVDGFRRANRSWTGTAVVPVADFTKEEIAALKGEQKLVVDEIEVPDQEAGSNSSKTTKTAPPK